MFSANRLPVLAENSDGVAVPKPSEPVAAAKPLNVISMAPWGTEITVDPAKGYWVIAQSPEDIYPNDEFSTFYEVGEELLGDDPRTEALRNLLGDVVVVEATKTKAAKIVGMLAEAGTFQTYEGPVAFERGDVLLESPDLEGRMWPVTAAVFAKKYDRKA